MTVDELELVARLGEAESLSDEALGAAEASLRSAMAGPSPESIGPRRRSRRSVAVVAAAAAAAAVAAGSLALAGGNATRPKSVPRATGTHRAATVRPGRSKRFDLAGYSVALPAGYQADSQNCPALPSNFNVAVRTLGQANAAATPSGACIEAFLAGGPFATPPSGAQPVQLGSYQGYLVTNPDNLELWIGIPAASGQHALVFYSSGMSADRLIAVAESGLPVSSSGNSAVQGPPCTSDCG